MNLFDYLEAVLKPAAKRRGLARRLLGAAWSLVSWSAVIAAVFALLAVLAIVLVPRALGWQGMVVLSGSMEPALEAGSIAFVEPGTAGGVALGQMLTFTRDGGRRTLVTHRVIEIVDSPAGVSFRTKGDANADADLDLVAAGQVVGTVRYSLPYLGQVVDMLRGRQNYYIFVGIPAALLILNELTAVAVELKRQRRQGVRAGAGVEGSAA